MYFKVVHFSDKLQTLTYNIGHDAAIMIVDKNVEEATLMSSAHELWMPEMEPSKTKVIRLMWN